MKIDTGSRGERKSRGSERTTRHPRGKPSSVGVDPIVIVPPRLKRGSIWAASNEETRRDRGAAGQAECRSSETDDRHGACWPEQRWIVRRREWDFVF